MVTVPGVAAASVPKGGIPKRMIMRWCLRVRRRPFTLSRSMNYRAMSRGHVRKGDRDGKNGGGHFITRAGDFARRILILSQ
jgi:hypothetical protein